MEMDLTSPNNIKEILLKYNTRPSKSLGQNFLIDKNILSKIVEASDIKNTDTILEVGPGLGVLTQELIKKAKKVIAVEKDKTMIDILKEITKNANNLEIINGDVLKSEEIKNIKDKYKVVANIPYYLTAPLIRNFLEATNQPEEIILMIQKEVAQRICSNPPNMSLLSIAVQFYADAKIFSYVSKNCFWPAPKIDSAIIKIIPQKNKNNISSDLFFKIVKAGFSHPRKQLSGNLSIVLKKDRGVIDKLLEDADINPKRRAETLSIDEWIKIAKDLERFVD